MNQMSALFVSARPPAPVPGATAPLTPARYVQLRRRAAGLTVDHAAECIAATDSKVKRPEARAMIRLLETPGTLARRQDMIEMLARAIPLDPDVYRQLATEPADRHPSVCRGCGCSYNDPCHLGSDHLCRMLPGEPAICTRCTGGEWQ